MGLRGVGLARWCGRPIRPASGAEVARGIKEEGRRGAAARVHRHGCRPRIVHTKVKNTIASLLRARADDWLTGIVLSRWGFFQHVHPNAITITGMVLNFCIFYAMTHERLGGTILMLGARYLADCLDGGVARKYDKQSKMGGVLDSASDAILIYVSTLGIFHLYNLPYGSASAALVSCLNLFMMSLSGSLVDHAGMKVGGSYLEILYAFLVNNSYILFIAKIVLVYVAIEVDPVW